ncbi:MAG TPA: hypothetical protein VGF55_10960, partial [Gemmataceae bacterium]
KTVTTGPPSMTTAVGASYCCAAFLVLFVYHLGLYAAMPPPSRSIGMAALFAGVLGTAVATAAVHWAHYFRSYIDYAVQAGRVPRE